MSYTEASWPKDRWPNFAFNELACSEPGECVMDAVTMNRLQRLRDHFGDPLVITSGYRSPAHSIEVAKSSGPDTHAKGRAADVACAGVDAYDILAEALLKTDGNLAAVATKQGVTAASRGRNGHRGGGGNTWADSGYSDGVYRKADGGGYVG